jgi:hypothetical protein
MNAELSKRMRILKEELAPWPDPNYAIDESWAAVDLYKSEARDGKNLTLSLRTVNHAPRRETYHVKWNVPAGWRIVEANRGSDDCSRQGRRGVFTVKGAGLSTVTADIEFAGRQCGSGPKGWYGFNSNAG